MIIFDLTCSADHRFEGWFRSAEDFSRQEADGMVLCPYCGSHEVKRLPSAVHVASAAAPMPAPEAGRRPAADPLAAAKRFVEEMIRHSDDVGSAFAEEARRIHYRESPERAIRGVATADECAALQEEGIDVLRLPRPKKREELN
ncbi:DUF1178 family protein [Azospira restricta]|uniref:DUF1178 family protein n=1 Tax=Azospira restricta TaxID=404405 RepID=A0A974PWL0_9RHOO|nr:DUF1178 family protein [Azospira restricta]QRJ62789.1 DUF1178 family protein [Azospira restricta]